MECICLFCGRSLHSLYSNISAVYRTSKKRPQEVSPNSCYYVIGERDSIYRCGIRDIEIEFPCNYNNNNMGLVLSSIKRIETGGITVSNSVFDYQLELDLKGIL